MDFRHHIEFAIDVVFGTVVIGIVDQNLTVCSYAPRTMKCPPLVNSPALLGADYWNDLPIVPAEPVGITGLCDGATTERLAGAGKQDQ